MNPVLNIDGPAVATQYLQQTQYHWHDGARLLLLLLITPLDVEHVTCCMLLPDSVWHEWMTDEQWQWRKQ